MTEGALASPEGMNWLSPEGVTYAYDTVKLGTVSSVANSVSTTAYTAYDALSRVTGSSQTPAGQSNPFAFNYGYNRQGALSSEVRPSGRTVTYGFDAAGRVNGVTGTVATTPTNYASSVTYASNGGVAQMTFGNSVVETTSYSANRQQATGVTAASGAGTLLSLGYSYCATYAATCSSNNGNVWQQTMARPAGSWTQAYGYSDGLNRLNSVAETGIGTGWSEGYTYDAFGNRWVSSTNEQTLTAETPTASSWFGSNNRIIGWGYDSAGNITSVSSMQRMFTYDAENRQTSAAINGAGAAYGYDGQGQRVTKTAGGTTTTYVYDAPGDLVAEYGGASNSDTGTLYLTVDALGSTRLATDVNGAQKLCYDYLPFGQEIGAGVDGRPGNCFTTDSLDTKFTGQKRDSETGLDYFGARYFSGAQGRFGGADAPFNDQDPGDPQSWNLFSYGRNNPLVNVDPTGQACVHSTDAIGQKILDDDGGGCRELTDSGNTATVNGSTDHFLALANGIARAGAVTAPKGIAAFYASRAPNNVTLTPQAQGCQAKIQGAVNNALNTNSTFLGPTSGPGHESRWGIETALTTSTTSHPAW